MKQNNSCSIWFACSFAWLLLLAACSKPPLPVTYHTLSAEMQHSGTRQELQSMLLIGPVELNTLLAKGPLVKQQSAHSLSLLEQHQWAGDLPTMVQQVIARNLQTCFGSNQIARYPESSAATGLRLALTVFHFEENSEGKALLEAEWRLLDNSDQSIIHSAIWKKVLPPKASGYDGLAAALSSALAELSSVIADTIIEIQSSQQKGEEYR